MDWICKTWTGSLKHGFVKHGFVKGGFVKHQFVTEGVGEARGGGGGGYPLEWTMLHPKSAPVQTDFKNRSN